MQRFACVTIVVGLIGVMFVLPWSASAEHVKLSRGGVPFGMLDRVFPLKYKNGGGTCFVIDVDNRQYIITARHLLPDIKNGEPVQLYINREWRTLVVKPVFPASPKTDIVALAADQLVMPKMEILVGGDGMMMGQDAYFLGFPHLPPTPYLELATLFQNRQLPFVKKATISALASRLEAGNVFYLDGHNNPGFSGGPVIFANYTKKECRECLQIAGVISGYKIQITPIGTAEITESPSRAQRTQTKIIPYVPENSGIVIAYGIEEIIAAIRANPIGFPVLQQKR